MDNDCKNLPCPTQIAFALLIVRTKPTHSSIEEHISSLQKAVVHEQRPGSSTTLDFDPALYWEGKYQLLESERVRLLDEIAVLKDGIGADQEPHVPKSSELSSALGKRKRSIPSILKDVPHSKRKSHVTVEVPVDDILESPGANVGVDRFDRITILRGFFTLRHRLQLDQPCRVNLLPAVQAITSGLCKSFQLVNGHVGNDNTEAEDYTADELLGVLGQVYPSILRALQHMEPEIDENGDVLFPGVLDVIRLFETILRRLHKFAVEESVARGDETKPTSKASRPKTKAAKPPASGTTDRDLTKGRTLARTLIKLTTTLDLSQDVHCELLEGFFCALLDHVGTSLSLVVFSDSESRGAGIVAPKALLDHPHIGSDDAVRIVKVEGPYLICILRQALEFLHANTANMSERGMLLFSLQRPTKEKSLRQLIETTIQNSLLRGVFGDDDDTFYNVFRRDEGLLNHDLDQMVEEMKAGEESAEWFIGQLWEHLGWDILSGKRALQGHL